MFMIYMLYNLAYNTNIYLYYLLLLQSYQLGNYLHIVNYCLCLEYSNWVNIDYSDWYCI